MTDTTFNSFGSLSVSEKFGPIDVAGIVCAIRDVLPRNPLALHEPSIRGREWEYIKDCLDSGWVSYAGQYVERFEKMLEQATGAKHAVAMTSGTAALHTALIVCGVKSGDEVLIPTLTFVATANAVAHAGATPHLIDSDLDTLGIDIDRLSAYLDKIVVIRDGQCINRITSRRIAAVIPMHTFGHPVDMDGLIELANFYGITIIEDAAESLGSKYKGKATGTFGRIAAMSFNGNKIITTGGGGALLTDESDLARHAKHLTTTAKLPHKWEFRHDEIGYNYRMPSLNAALGCAQLEQLQSFLTEKRALALKYKQALAIFDGIDFFLEPVFASSNYWLNVILVKPELANDFVNRDNLLEALNGAGVMARPAWTLMHRLSMFAGCPRMNLSVAESLERRLINIPSSAGLVDILQ